MKETDTTVPECLVITSGAGAVKNQAILTWQKPQKRWIPHLISDGDYTADIRKDFAAASCFAGRYPAEGWEAALEQTETGVRVKVQGDAEGRLLVLE